MFMEPIFQLMVGVGVAAFSVVMKGVMVFLCPPFRAVLMADSLFLVQDGAIISYQYGAIHR